jgi:mannosyltransferase OCH1-like enzyme
MTPKIIHQIWLGSDLPASIDSWKRQNPSCTHILWNEQNLKNWQFHSPETIRYEILYHMGGVFVDANIPCHDPLKASLFQYECATLADSSIIAAQPRCELMRLCIEEPARLLQVAQKHQYPIKIFSEMTGPPEEEIKTCRRLGVLCHFRYKMKSSATMKFANRD